MTYPDALAFLGSLINYEKTGQYDYRTALKLGRMQKLAGLLGDPQAGIRSVHVAGTKGKGSTAAFIASILTSAGLRTGLYTSPHLVSFRERIRLDGTLIGEDALARFATKVRDLLPGMEGDQPTFFEVYTALAFLYFQEEKADCAVYETGLGGRLDATNIIDPLVSVITPISYDHMDILGRTLGAIAGEKAGIIKEGGVCVVAPQEGEALEVIEAACKERNARCILLGRDVRFKEVVGGESGEVFSVSSPGGEYPNLETGLLGSHQVVNAATAIAAVEALRPGGIIVPPDAIREGVKRARWPGRLEIAGHDPLLVLDGAQNRASAAALAAAVQKIFDYRRLVLVLGISKDKDIAGILDELIPLADTVVLTRSNVPGRALEPLRLAEAVRQKGHAAPIVTTAVAEALRRSRTLASPDDLILVTGSLFVVGEAKAALSGGTDA